MGISVSPKGELANLGYYGGGTLLGVSLIAALVLRTTGLGSGLSLKSTGALLPISSTLSGAALISGLLYRRRVPQSRSVEEGRSESTDESESSSSSTEVSDEDSPPESTNESESSSLPKGVSGEDLPPAERKARPDTGYPVRENHTWKTTREPLMRRGWVVSFSEFNSSRGKKADNWRGGIRLGV